MNTLLRFLGIQLVASAAARLPGPLARLVTAVVLVVVNLLPVWAVMTERIGMGDVFIVYWIENVVVWACGIVRTATAEGPGKGTVAVTTNGRPGDMSSAKFFALHYGIFTLVHGVFAFVMAFLAGGDLHPGTWLLAGLTLALSHVGSLWLNWYDGGERWRVSATTAMWQPYPRMLVLHVAIILGLGLALRSVGSSDTPGRLEELAPVLLLLGLKTGVDLALHLWERRRARSATPVGTA